MECLKRFIIYLTWRIDTTRLTECCSAFLRELLVMQLVTKSVASTEHKYNYYSDNSRPLGRIRTRRNPF